MTDGPRRSRPEEVTPAAVTVVLVHWNQAARLERTVEAFLSEAERVVVVDNGSSLSELTRARLLVDVHDGRVEILEQGANTGFGPAANAGLWHWLRSGVGTWVVLAPHDALPAPGTVARIVEELERRPAGGLACADVGDGHVPVFDPYFGGMTVPRSTGRRGGHGQQCGGWEPVDYPHGTLLVARRECLEDVGLFDERYFAYCEEADLGVRARTRGWEVGLVRGAMVVNPTMRSGSPAVDYLMQRNTLLLVRRHSGRYHAGIRFVIALWQLVRGIVQPSSRGFVFDARGRAMGLRDALLGRFGPPPGSLLAGAAGPETRGLPQTNV